MEHGFLESVNQIKISLYVNDLISAAATVEKGQQLKNEAIKSSMIQQSSSNVQELEAKDCANKHEETHAREELGESTKRQENELPGLTWQKGSDSLHVNFPPDPEREAKRGNAYTERCTFRSWCWTRPFPAI